MRNLKFKMKELIEGNTGAKFSQKEVIRNSKGDIRKIIPTGKAEDSTPFLECYFSNLNQFSTKKWKKDSVNTQHLSVAFGRIVVICIKEESNANIFEEFELDDNDNHGILEIPPGIIYGIWTGMTGAVVLNTLFKLYNEADKVEVYEDFSIQPKKL